MTLSESLRLQLEKHKVEAEVFTSMGFLTRLISFKSSGLSFHFWLKEKLFNYLKDYFTLKMLKKFDAIIVSECIPNGFLKRMYNVERFKKIINKPIVFYEVYYLGNGPTQIAKLQAAGDALLERYDFHLSVSDVTEIKHVPSFKWYPIGLYARSWGLQPFPKKELVAIIDFLQPGYEEYRKSQISALKKTGIKYISLEKPYTISDIRNLYQGAALFFVQFPEAFGLPILECFCCGCQVFTPYSGWPMSWRLNENPSIHGEGILPSCFTVYGDEHGLIDKLNEFKKKYNNTESPKKVFQTFIDHYPAFYNGNDAELQRLLKNLGKNRKLKRKIS